jgi:hypothetical protein
MWLMQDGTVLVCLASDGKTLKSLHPDSRGSYANGSWSDAGTFLLAKMNFASAVLPDGRLVACGGEQSGPGFPTTETNFCEIYDSITKSSTQFASPPASGSTPAWGSIGDSPTVVLADGTFMIGNTQGWGSQVALLNAATLTWTFGTGDGGPFGNNEEGYVLLQNGDVLTAHVYQPWSLRYDPGSKAFTRDADLPVMLGAGSEIGPGIAMMDGGVIWFGASGHTCIYQPGPEGHNGSWTQGPDLPKMPDGTQLVANDTSAILEPNGKVFLVTWWSTGKIIVFLEYDPVKNEFVVIQGAPRTANGQAAKMLLLPNGHGLVSILKDNPGDDNGLYDVTFDSGAQASWAPTITCFPETAARNQTVTLIGTQLCGLSECQHFGDDNQQAENYPMVRFIDNSGGVTYARAHDVSTRSVAPMQSGSVLVDIPGTLSLGTSSVEAVAMGIPSRPATVNIVARSLKFAVLMAPANQPYQWWWGLTGDEVGQKLQASGMQLRNISAYVDLDNTVKFTAILGPSTGQSWWYWGLSAPDLGAKLTENNARLIDLCPYVAPDGSLRFVAIMVGASGEAWWWYWGQTADQINSLLHQHKAVLTKISPYWDNGSLRFAAIMAPDVGQKWWWYWGQSGQDVQAKLAANNAELTDIAAYVDQSDSLRFAVLMGAPTGAPWWWWGLEACGISQKLSASNARPTVLAPYIS